MGRKTEPEPPRGPRRAGQSESGPRETHKGKDTAPGSLPLLFPQKGRAPSQEWGHHHCHHSMTPPRPSRSSGRERMARREQNQLLPMPHPPSTYITWGLQQACWREADKTSPSRACEPRIPLETVSGYRLTHITHYEPLGLAKAGSQGTGPLLRLRLPALLPSQACTPVAPTLSTLPVIPPVPGLLIPSVSLPPSLGSEPPGPQPGSWCA